MKKILGWICLIGSAIWCFLMIPGMVIVAGAKLWSFFNTPTDYSDTIHYGLVLLGVLGTVAMSFLVTIFGKNILKSSWKMARGVDLHEEQLQGIRMRRQEKLNQKRHAMQNNARLL